MGASKLTYQQAGTNGHGKVGPAGLEDDGQNAEYDEERASNQMKNRRSLNSNSYDSHILLSNLVRKI